MASEYKYDEEGETWPFFVLAILTFILIPLTASWIYRAIYASDVKSYNASVKGAIVVDDQGLKVGNAEQISAYQRQRKSAKIFNKTLVILIIGWALVIYIAVYATKEADLSGVFDPYAILEISSSATEKEVKSRYRKLSLKFHPDKLPKDLSEKAKEEMEATFILINSAYKALTDEVTRANFLQYGHPDGRQEVSHGIALPKFLVEGKYSPIMVVLYFLVIGVLLPFIVGSWWSNVKSHTRKGLHVETAALFARKLTDRNPATVVTPETILDWVLQSTEVQTTFKHLSTAEIKTLVEKHFDRDFEYVKTNPSLEADKVRLVALLPNLINGLLDIVVVFRHIDIIVAAQDLQKAVIQAVRPTGKYQELLQLPFVDPEVVRKQPITKLGKLFTLSKEDAKKTLGIKDDAQLDAALNVASHIPSLRIIESEFKVPGEEVLPPSSKAHLSLKFLVKSPKLKSIPEISEDRLKDEETLDYMKDPTYANSSQPELPFSYAPYFPTGVRNHWSAYLILQKDNRLVEGTTDYKIEHIDLRNLELSQEVWKEGKESDVTIGSYNIALNSPTPPNAGTFHFRILIKNNAYYGADVDIPLFMDVENPPMKVLPKIVKEEVESDDESDISDPEEDSLAGALAALRGEPPKSKKIEEVEEGESDSESVFTDINTDTEDEGDS
ncbi:translocation protein [Scheffersomyces xylosifermentans]|uniref:translocation protein n=1 Tax=Scheffersomyces xylosifermentans TaxID=1304137 RepID=UPI00315D1376